MIEPDETYEEKLSKELENWLPLIGDKLFQESEDGVPLNPFGSLHLNGTRPYRWDLYAEGYLKAADLLVEKYEQCPLGDGDAALLYPIIALCRHHLELKLKILINSTPEYFSELSEDELSAKVKKLNETHSLKRLYEMLRNVYPQCGGWTGQDQISAFEKLLLEFDEHDPTSQAARYPTDKKGNESFPGMRTIDLQIFKEGVAKMSHHLDCIYEYRCQQEDWRAEMESL